MAKGVVRGKGAWTFKFNSTLIRNNTSSAKIILEYALYDCPAAIL